MTIQSVNSAYQTMNSVRTDFRNFSTAANSLQSALSSGNQDQVTLSESALSQALGQLLSDAPTAQGQSSGTGGKTDPMQAFQNDLQTLQSALSSTDGNQGASSSATLDTALSNVLNDISFFTQDQSAGTNNNYAVNTMA